jgi:hypothetical protein
MQIKVLEKHELDSKQSEHLSFLVLQLLRTSTSPSTYMLDTLRANVQAIPLVKAASILAGPWLPR